MTRHKLFQFATPEAAETASGIVKQNVAIANTNKAAAPARRAGFAAMLATFAYIASKAMLDQLALRHAALRAAEALSVLGVGQSVVKVVRAAYMRALKSDTATWEAVIGDLSLTRRDIYEALGIANDSDTILNAVLKLYDAATKDDDEDAPDRDQDDPEREAIRSAMTSDPARRSRLVAAMARAAVAAATSTANPTSPSMAALSATRST